MSDSSQRQNVVVYLLQECIKNIGLASRDFNELLEHYKSTNNAYIVFARLIKDPNDALNRKKRLEMARQIRIKALEINLGYRPVMVPELATDADGNFIKVFDKKDPKKWHYRKTGRMATDWSHTDDDRILEDADVLIAIILFGLRSPSYMKIPEPGREGMDQFSIENAQQPPEE